MSKRVDHLTFVERVVISRIVWVHNLLYQKTRGHFGHHMPGMPPSLLLHTSGAKTGIPRTVALTYARDGVDFLVVASWAGSPVAPGWYHNLIRNPVAHINVGRQRIPVIAQAILPGQSDYDRLWRIVNDNYANRYDIYQQRTTRPIPIVRLAPA
ncbi:nitroreductase/quinone reductase family protein [Mycobacterium sp. Aquia_216]|uniref:nitroreductase/quinone reductase family protein n=1 Tax=Mycobacterium sp. Aquia_216 TaxID=2991729 RepID=UPI00227BFABC|nr:nitroreductase/quinone reductase family protein [Mycobacterium sp. Aquia_216]WAJ45308.1 nitroreductase/quinone reductase family protein [Mycobacterium sp. Aquia_216]